MGLEQLELTDWRRRTAELFAAVRAESDPAAGHARWRTGRDELFRSHPQSPLLPDDPMRAAGLPYWPYDPDLRFEVAVERHRRGRLNTATCRAARRRPASSGSAGAAARPIGESVDVWWLRQYGGGSSSRSGRHRRHTSYGGGRYALDTAKWPISAGDHESLVLDLNFLYHPSCRYNPAWVCPLAPPGNTIAARIDAGERMSF